jgi:hypothetical protein
MFAGLVTPSCAEKSERGREKLSLKSLVAPSAKVYIPLSAANAEPGTSVRSAAVKAPLATAPPNVLALPPMLVSAASL